MTFIIIVLLIIVFWPWISRWIKGFLSRRAEDTIRRMMGMPTRKEEERLRKEQAKRQRNNSTYTHSSSSYSARDHEAARREAINAMKEYAVDVEYVEIKEERTTSSQRTEK